jgi:hypothetical protein
LLKQGIVIQSVITFRISENLIYLNRNIITWSTTVWIKYMEIVK